MELKRRGKETKIWVSVEAKLNFATRRVDINACFGHKSTCSYVSEGEVRVFGSDIISVDYIAMVIPWIG